MSKAWGILAAAVLLTGCGHYQMGAGPAPSFTSLYIEPAKNKTPLAQTREITSTMLREAFIRDGRVEVMDNGEADATLEVTLITFRRENSANREDDNGLARKFTLHLTASCSLRDNRTGRMLFENRLIEVQREMFTDNGLGDVPFGTSNDQLQAEYNTFPLLADQLADRVTHAVLDVW